MRVVGIRTDIDRLPLIANPLVDCTVAFDDFAGAIDRSARLNNMIGVGPFGTISVISEQP